MGTENLGADAPIFLVKEGFLVRVGSERRKRMAAWMHCSLRIIKLSENLYYHLQLRITHITFRLDRDVIMGEGGGHSIRGGSGEGQFHLGRCYTALAAANCA